jgi:hypothetical protein
VYSSLMACMQTNERLGPKVTVAKTDEAQVMNNMPMG